MIRIDGIIRDLELKQNKLFEDGSDISYSLRKYPTKKMLKERDVNITRTQEINKRLRFYKNLREALIKRDIYDKTQKTR